MKTKLLAVAAIALGLVTTPALAARKEKLTGEAQLAKLLDGRQPGKPVNCLPLGQATETRIIDKTALVYRYGNTLYVNRPTNARSLDDDDILVTTIRGGSLCRLDTVRLHDRTSQFYNGFVGLQDFVPYARPKGAPRG